MTSRLAKSARPVANRYYENVPLGFNYWYAPDGYFAGHDVFILGGGPSINDWDLETRLRRHHSVIAINNAWQLAPHADVLYFADRAWWNWNADDVREGFKGEFVVSRSIIPSPELPKKNLKTMAKANSLPLSLQQNMLAGWDSGSNAINLAYLMGARRVFLFGFDMRPGSYHDKHLKKAPDEHYQEKFIPSHEAMAQQLGPRWLRTQVWNCTPGSALTCWPFMNPEDVGVKRK